MGDDGRVTSSAAGMGDDGQVTSSAAEVYDAFFLPALFAAWPRQLVQAAQLAPGMEVLDVACGTGALTLAVAEAVAPGGHVTGVDLNEGMLAVARGKSASIEWQKAAAEVLPFDRASFDAVVSQFGLMFFVDRSAALREMWRVLRPGGHLAIAVWATLRECPGYARMVALLARLFGDEVADLLRVPYSLGDPEAFGQLVARADIPDSTIEWMPGEARFPSIRSWIHTDVRGWTLSEELDDEQFERLVAEAERELANLVGADGAVRFDHPALIATAHKP
jgi:SAM-dependent methyltransferase